MFVYHSTVFLTVNRLAGNELAAECTQISNDLEAVGRLITDVKNLKIKQAEWALYRHPDRKNGRWELPELKGVTAYLDAGPDLKRALGGAELEIARELIAEAVRGIVQAETFFFGERGFASAADYDAFWDNMYRNSCYYYSHLDEVEKTWMDYVGPIERPYNLFNRSKTATVTREDGGVWRVTAVFIDSFHELGIEFLVDGHGLIQSARGDYTSAPSRICWRNTGHLEKFTGCSLTAFSKKDIALRAGGSEGCNHLVDIIYEAVQAYAAAVRQFENRREA